MIECEVENIATLKNAVVAAKLSMGYSCDQTLHRAAG
jgi:hypothetical protein